MPDFNAYQIYKEIKNGARTFMNRVKEIAHDGTIQEYPAQSSRPHGEPDCLGIDDRALELFFRHTLQADTLKSNITDRQCTFLVNIMTDNNHSQISYEAFLDFIIPKTKKKITQKLLVKIRQN